MVCIAGIEYALPDRSVTLEALGAGGRLTSTVDALRSFGFDVAWVAGAERDTLASRAVGRLLDRAGIDPATIDVLFYAGASPGVHAARETLLGGFSYPASKLQYDMGLGRARTIGISQTGCLGLMSSVSLGRSVLEADPSVRRVLCVSVDVLPEGSTREILYNVISDGACAVLLERGEGPNRIVAERQVTKGYYWDCEALGNEIVAAYFPTARAIIRDTLASTGLTADDIALVVPHNVSLRSWEILLQLTGLSRDRLFADNIPARGHVIAADTFMNLKDAGAARRLRPGDRALLFNFGFGATWACMVVEH